MIVSLTAAFKTDPSSYSAQKLHSFKHEEKIISDP